MTADTRRRIAEARQRAAAHREEAERLPAGGWAHTMRLQGAERLEALARRLEAEAEREAAR